MTGSAPNGAPLRLRSTTEWHRYADQQPKPGSEVIVKPTGWTLTDAAGFYLDGATDEPLWVFDAREDDLPPEPDDLWCYLPSPPTEPERDPAAELAEALRSVYDFLRREYPEPNPETGEVIEAPARHIWGVVCDALAAYEASRK